MWFNGCIRNFQHYIHFLTTTTQTGYDSKNKLWINFKYPSHKVIHAFSQQRFIECLLYARH